ncbi:hypothetical protein NFI96_013255 [Prochilodus magdalenae]|nr:hypothetical protein NFI96_013255 [Prochilodus magdalenae]
MAGSHSQVENMAPQQQQPAESSEAEDGDKGGLDTPLAEARPVATTAPDGGWGWVILLATIMVLALTLAFPSCMGIFYTDLQKQFDASNSVTSWVPSIMTAVLHAGGPLCSVLVERFGCRATVMLGGVLSGLGMAASAFTNSIIELYITAGLITVLQLTWVSVTTSTMVLYLDPTEVSQEKQDEHCQSPTAVNVSDQTFKNRPHEGGLRARCPVVGPVLTGQYRRACLAFATEHQNFQIRHRCLVLFTDESRFYLSKCDRRDRLWRHPGECYTACNIIQHDWFGGGSVMVWGGISLEGHTDLYRLDNGTLTAIRHRDKILGPLVRPYAGAVGPGFLLVHNNARPRVARVCRQFLENKGTDTIDWPTGSPDLNPIEHLWDIMFRSIRRHQVALQTVQELSDALVQIPQDNIILLGACPHIAYKRLGFCFSFQPAVTILGHYFVRRRVFANAMSSTGTALGLSTLPMLSHYLHIELGWRGSFLVLGGILLNCCVCGAVMRPLNPRRPKQPKRLSNGPSVASEEGLKGHMLVLWKSLASSFRRHMAFDQFCNNQRFRVFSLGITWMMLGFIVPLIFLVPYATDNGMDQKDAALLLNVLGFVNVLVRPPIGLLFNLSWFKGRHIYVFSTALLLNGLSNSICCIGPTFSVLLIYMLSYGLTMSVVGTLLFTVLMDIVDMSRFHSALGLLAIMESVTLLIGPPLAGYLVDKTGDYTYVFVASTITVALSALFLLVSFYLLDHNDAVQREPSPSPGSAPLQSADCQYIRVSAGGVCGFSPVPQPDMVVLNAVLATLVYIVWEMLFPYNGSKKDAKKEKKEQEAKALLKRVIHYSRPDYPHLGTAFLFLILAALFESYIPYYVGKIIDVLSGEYQHGNFMWAIGLMSLYSLGSSLFSGLRGGMFMCSLSRLNRRIRHMLFRNLMKQEINFFVENKPGSLTSRLVSDTDKMGRSVAMNVNVLLRSLVKTCSMLISMLNLSWQLTILTCIEMPLLALLQNHYNTYYQKASRELQNCKAEIEQLASSAIDAMKTVRSFRAEAQELKRYEEALARKLKVQKQKGICSAVFLLLRRTVSVSLKVAMLLVGRSLILSGHLSSGGLLAFVLFQKDMVTNMRHLVYVYGDILNTVWSAEKVFQLLDRTPKVREAGDLVPQKLDGRLTFDEVSFSYPSRDVKALKSVSLELSPGKMTALVGPSGGGKSSCVSLLQRFYEPQEGKVLLDGVPLHCYDHQYLCSQMATVSQDPVLFSGSIKHNIEYGLNGCTVERVQEAAKKANIHDFICRLDQGYDTDVGGHGGQLSAGQKQCIAIARAFIRNPKILILDEGTSKLDSNTQLAVQEALSGSPGQTVLVVAHRLQTIEKADHIIYMEDGMVMEQGTHEQLMAKRGCYYSLRQKLFAQNSEQH